MPIQVLDQSTINKIAAGEVIERPSSVVKELVENAIDAKATAVTVEIKDGGISFIRITDNGSGINAKELPLAFLPHSTSKIRSIEDLAVVSSLGFRGEALASIASVSQIELITKTKDAFTGARYVIEGGEEKSLQDVGAPDGTTFIVRNLFYNTPVRRKFLKTATTEAGYVNALIEHLALSHPDISFRFINNNQNKLHTSGNTNLRDIIYHVYGRDIASNLLAINTKTQDITIEGFIGKPLISRGNRTYENYFINGRFIKSNVITKAIEEAYKGFIMMHKYPFTAMHFKINPEIIDVNVHPTKMELRFSKNEFVYEFVLNAVRNVLKNRELIPNVELTDVRTHKQENSAALNTYQQNIGQSNRTDTQSQQSKPLLNNTKQAYNTQSTFSGNRNPINGQQQNSTAIHQNRQSESTDSSITSKHEIRDVAHKEVLSEKTMHAGVDLNNTKRIDESDRPVKSSEQTASSTASNNSAENEIETVPTDKTDTSSAIEVAQSMAQNEVVNTPVSEHSAISGNVENAGKMEDSIENHPELRQNRKERLPEPFEKNRFEKLVEEENKTLDYGQKAEQMELFPHDRFLDKANKEKHKIIGQVFDTYWLIQFEDKLFIMDQHAAHEKVLFEKLMKKLSQNEMDSQMVNPPMILSLNMREEEILKKHRKIFTKLGYEIEEFGGNEYKVVGTPASIPTIDTKDLLIEILDGLVAENLGQTPDLILEKVASMSCKAAVKGNNQLSVKEVETLIDELFEAENPYNCPHGRPTLISMSKYELEKKFKRIV